MVEENTETKVKDQESDYSKELLLEAHQLLDEVNNLATHILIKKAPKKDDVEKLLAMYFTILSAVIARFELKEDDIFDQVDMVSNSLYSPNASNALKIFFKTEEPQSRN